MSLKDEPGANPGGRVALCASLVFVILFFRELRMSDLIALAIVCATVAFLSQTVLAIAAIGANNKDTAGKALDTLTRLFDRIFKQ
jgi:hypothetical protein